MVCGVIKPRSRAQSRLFLRAVKLGAGWVLGAKALPLEGWAPLPPSSSKELAQVHNGAQVHLLRMQPWMGGGRTHRTVAKVIVLLKSPWQLLPWTAPHHCLAAVAQATHGLSWLLQLWGTQGLGVGDSAGRPLSARQQCWDWRGMMCPLPKAVATIAAGLGACLGQRYLCRVAPRTHSQT